MTLDWVTTLTELKISTFLASSSVSQAMDFFSLPSLSHGIELNAQFNLLHLSMVCSFLSMSLFCLQLPRNWGGFCGGSTTVPVLSLLLGSQVLHRAPFSWKRSGREMSPSLAHLQGTQCCLRVNNKEGAVPKLLLLGNCLDKHVYPFRERHRAPLHPNDHTSFILPAAVPQNTLCSNDYNTSLQCWSWCVCASD